jgi:hypothetical protein
MLNSKWTGLVGWMIGLGLLGLLDALSVATPHFGLGDSACIPSSESAGEASAPGKLKAGYSSCPEGHRGVLSVRREVVQIEGMDFVAGELLVRFQDGVPEEEIRRIITDAGCEMEEYIPLFRIYHLRTVERADAEETLAKAAKLNRLPEVDYAEPNVIYRMAVGPANPNDPAFTWQWSLSNIGQAHPTVASGKSTGLPGADIGILQAWENGWTDSRSAAVAIIDSGLALEPDSDLIGNVVKDAAYDFTRGDADPDDEIGHGTFVAGIIGAVGNNAMGISGISWKASLVPLKAVARLSVTESMGRRVRILLGLETDDFYKAMLTSLVLKRGLDILEESEWRWIPEKIRRRVEQGLLNIRVINFSMATESPQYLESLQRVLRKAQESEILVVTAAGNQGWNLDKEKRRTYPCALGVQFDNVICVGASTDRDELASFSNFGVLSVHLVAPGKDVVGLVPPRPAGRELPLLEGTGCRRLKEDLAVCSGTSFATAHVAGVAALLFALCPAASASQVRELLRQSVKVVPQLQYQVAWEGRLRWPQSAAVLNCP